MTNLYCIVSMSTFSSAPMSLTANSLIPVKIRALNGVGSGGAYSTVNIVGATVKTVPTTPTSSLMGITYTKSESSISLAWTAPVTTAQTGYSPITSYSVYWNSGTGNPDIPLIDSLITTYTVNGLTEGTTYIFKIRAKNLYGYGSFSANADWVTITATGIPDIMNSVDTNVLDDTDPNDVKIIVDWTSNVPDDHGETIDLY